MKYHGLTWDHPRGYNALAEAESRGGPVHWDVQPLEGFESAPIAELCKRYDLVVMDHPHLGEALATDCLQPLENLLSPRDIDKIANGAVGPSFTSYQMRGKTWALPLDAATQVMAIRSDLTEDVPTTWNEVVKLASAGKVALPLAGPHVLMCLWSITAAVAPGLHMGDGRWPELKDLETAFEILAEVAASNPSELGAMNPIGILGHMVKHDDIAVIPLVYGYVNYADPALEKPVSFVDAPHVSDGYPGSIIGGTGIAVSARAEVSDALRDHLLWLLSPEAQTGFIPAHDGQPGLECAWLDDEVNQGSGDFYRNTIKTLRQSTVRPRHNGYIAFQTRVSAYLRDALTQRENGTTVAQTVTEMYHASRA
ncbi:MAG: extracellular solute-binding protein [Roseovarius sp.]|nr:extracellular solute-binding protein [Roseovarius sp.]